MGAGFLLGSMRVGFPSILGGSWDLVSQAIYSTYVRWAYKFLKCSYLVYNPVTKSHDPPSIPARSPGASSNA